MFVPQGFFHLVLLIVGPCFGLDLESVWEAVVLPPTPHTPLNLPMLSSLQKWHIPMVNAAEYFATLKDVKGEEVFSGMKEEEEGEVPPCLYYSLNKGTAEVFGWGGKIGEYTAHPHPLRDGLIDWALEGVYIGSSYITLTDNETFLVLVNHWGTGLKGFSVISKEDKLEVAKLKQIREHLQELGFEPKFFKTFSYDNCKGMKEEL